jgi:hypothetical protein
MAANKEMAGREETRVGEDVLTINEERESGDENLRNMDGETGNKECKREESNEQSERPIEHTGLASVEGGNWKSNRWVVEGSHATGDDLGAEECPRAELKLKLSDPEDQSYICSKGSGAPNPSEGPADEKCENEEPTEHYRVDNLTRHPNLLLYLGNPVPETNAALEKLLEEDVFNCLEFVEAPESESGTFISMRQSKRPDQPDSNNVRPLKAVNVKVGEGQRVDASLPERQNLHRRDTTDSRALEETPELYEPTSYGRETPGDGRGALYVENIYIRGWLLRCIFQQLIDHQ